MNFRFARTKEKTKYQEGGSFLTKKIRLYDRSNEWLGQILQGENMCVDYMEDNTGQNVYLYIKSLGEVDDNGILSCENNVDYEAFAQAVSDIESTGYKNLGWYEVHPLEQIKIGKDYDFYIHFNK